MAIFTGELGWQFVTHLANHYGVRDLVRMAQLGADSGFTQIWLNDNIRESNSMARPITFASRVLKLKQAFESAATVGRAATLAIDLILRCDHAGENPEEARKQVIELPGATGKPGDNHAAFAKLGPDYDEAIKLLAEQVLPALRQPFGTAAERTAPVQSDGHRRRFHAAHDSYRLPLVFRQSRLITAFETPARSGHPDCAAC